MKNKLQNENKYCTGCGACFSKCPNNAIKMIYDMQYDFSLQAEINKVKCIDCGLCQDVCPVLNDLTNENFVNPLCYAVCSDDEIRKKSSSGGLFTLLANFIIDKNGYVCGAAYSENFNVRHILISSNKELHKLQRSKYIQSDLGLIFVDILKLLEDNKNVMFVGTPCQVAGLKAYLGKEYSNLLLVDFLCNYTPPHYIFDKYLDENYGLDNIKKIDFRIKNYGWVSDIHQIELKDDKVYIKRPNNDIYQKGYHSRLYMRKTCEECKFSGFPKQGDITIGDFWYIGNYNANLDDKKGTSVVLLNNTKSNNIFQNIINKLKICEQVPLELLNYNRPIKVNAHYSRNRFYQLIQKYTFNKSVEYAMDNKFDVGIVGIWSEKNYGSELTYYALYKVISNMGLEVQMIERPRDVAWKPNDLPILFKTNPYPEYSLCSLYNSKEEMFEINNRFDSVVVGSDQLWHRDLYECFGKICFLDFVRSDKRKISYATSFGKADWTGNVYDSYEASLHLKQFDYASVRELSGVDICRSKFNITVEWVLDPVFLCEREYFEKLALKSNMIVPDSFIGVYILDNSRVKQEILDYTKKTLGIELNVISDAYVDNISREWDINIIKNAYVEDWLKNIINCKFVITDSFHGMCFAIIFKKQFIVIKNENRGIARFVDLLTILNLQDRLVSDMNNISNLLEKQINFDETDKILNKEIVRSYSWLKKALFAEKNYKKETDSIVLDKMNEYLFRNVINNKNIHDLINLNGESIKGHDDTLYWQKEAIFRHEEAVNRHEESVKKHDDTLYWQKEAIFRHEEAVNRHEGSIKSHDDTLYWQKEAIFRHEEAVNRHEESIKSHDDTLYWQKEAIFRHEEAVNRHEESVKKYDDTLYWQKEAIFRHEAIVIKHEERLNDHNQSINLLNEEIVNLKNKINELGFFHKIKKIIKKII